MINTDMVSNKINYYILKIYVIFKDHIKDNNCIKKLNFFTDQSYYFNFLNFIVFPKSTNNTKISFG